MLKYLVAITILCGLTLFVARQDERATQESTQKASQSDNSAVPAKSNEQHPQENVEDANRNTPGWYSFFRWPTGTTTWAIILTLLAIAEQTTQTAKAAKATRDSVGHMENSAKAAHLNAQALISFERPWITVKVDSRVWDNFNLVATNIGRTPAEIVSAFGEWAIIKNESELPDIPIYQSEGMALLYRMIVAPNEPPFNVSEPVLVSAMRDGKPELVDDVERCEKELYWWGKIVYASALHKERKDLKLHETRWCFKYLPGSDKQDATGQPIGYPPNMVRGGKPGYNEHT